ncbi:MAG TPA: hypothetical protein VGV59_04680 [Pyrinomonadaceae bacterium]|nr:hypothetical protein [Pyrinomonadaceae bacterium]
MAFRSAGVALSSLPNDVSGARRRWQQAHGVCRFETRKEEDERESCPTIFA